MEDLDRAAAEAEAEQQQAEEEEAEEEEVGRGWPAPLLAHGRARAAAVTFAAEWSARTAFERRLLFGRVLQVRGFHPPV
jgi:hypothetical protein